MDIGCTLLTNNVRWFSEWVRMAPRRTGWPQSTVRSLIMTCVQVGAGDSLQQAAGPLHCPLTARFGKLQAGAFHS